MKKLLGFLGVAAIFASGANAQSTSSVVVSNCGTPPMVYSAGQVYPQTQNPAGNQCSNSSAPYYGVAGGSYRSVGVLPATGAYGGGLAANSIIGSFMWKTPGYKAVIRSFDFDPATTTAFTTAQFLELAVYPIAACVTQDSGGTDLSAYFGNPTDSNFPAISSQTFTMRGANSGATGLAAGNCTQGNIAYISPLRYTGTSIPQGLYTSHYSLHTADGAPFVLHNGQGLRIRMLNGVADVTGSVAEIIQIGWTVEPE